MFWRKKQEEQEELVFASDSNKEKKERNIFKTRSIKETLAPDGINPNPLSYLVINDHGMDCYIRTFYIHTMPKRVQFATAFSPLFDFENVTASVFMNPIEDGKSIRQLDNRIVKIESEYTEAVKNGDRNRRRKMEAKLRKTEQWAMNIENGENKLYEVGFLFSIFTKDLETLNINTEKFVSQGRNKGIELCSCYGVQPEAYLSNAPFNRIYSLKLDSYNLIKSTGIKMHVMDKYSLATVYHHTNASFSHKNGIPAGRNKNTGEPMLYDPYDPSHNGYSAIFSGKTGTGKSATMKMYVSRLKHKHYRFVSIDSDRKSGRGEFSTIAERLNGINFVIGNKSNNIINPFDANEHLEWDEATDTEFRTFRLNDKISNLVHIVMSMICGEEIVDFSLNKSMRHIVRTAVSTLYANRGIVDGRPDSLYEAGKVLQNGLLVDGKVKKKMPTFSDLYMQILAMKKIDTEKAHINAYTIILDAVGDWVKCVIYEKETLQCYTEKEYNELLQRNDVDKIAKLVTVRGTKPYFDGKTTIYLDVDTPYCNIDISDLPKDDIPVAQEFACNFVEENYMKRNSENPKKASRMIVIVDEAHRMFKNSAAREYLEDWYRTARKRHIAVWTCTQALKDFDGHDSTRAIIDNSTSIFLFKQDPLHEKFIKQATKLTDSQIEELFRIGGNLDDSSEGNAHKGECCLLDTNRAVFLKVDYLPSERYIVETNVTNLKQMYS